MKQDVAPTDWAAVPEVVQQIAADGPEPFDAALIANTGDLVEWLTRFAPDPVVLRGYWPTIIFDWDACSIEVFADRLELFRPGGDGQPLDFVYEFHEPGFAFSKDFADDLGALLGVPLYVLPGS